MSQKDIVREFFRMWPYEEKEQSEVTEWCKEEWKKRTGSTFEDVQRATRGLCQEGFLQRIDKGVFVYDPDKVKSKVRKQFTTEQKKAIFKRDNYTCQKCGVSKNNRASLAADHIVPIDNGGKSVVDNGQTLCVKCNNRKKNYGRTESSKREFISMLNKAKKVGDTEIYNFSKEILQVFDKHDINGHIKWKIKKIE